MFYCPHCTGSFVITSTIHNNVASALNEFHRHWTETFAEFEEKRRRELEAFEEKQRQELEAFNEGLKKVNANANPPGKPKTYAETLGDLPLLYNGQLLSVQETAKYGFKLTIYSATLMAAYQRMRDAMVELKTTGKIDGGADFGLFGELTRLLGVPQVMEMEKKYTG